MFNIIKNLDFVGRRKTWFTISLVVIALGLVFLALPGKGLRLGIDFTGGLYLDLGFPQGDAPSIGEVRDVLAGQNLQTSVVQRSVTGDSIIIRTPPMSNQERDVLLASLREQLPDFNLLQMEEVQPVIGRELTQRALLALLLASIGMVLYITIRFEFKFAICAIVALLHDALVSVGILSMLGTEVNSPFVAALLTIVGYSVNDTIVVFDRIRENAREREREPLPVVVNDSIRQTFSRSVNTSVTTLLAIGTILIFGGRTTRDFALALALGVMAGTYSSIFIASPLWTAWKLRDQRSQKSKPTPSPAVTATMKPGAPKKALAPAKGKSRPRPKHKAATR
ncbi:MAG: protein translocase subunit SecF [Bacillota bacterium]